MEPIVQTKKPTLLVTSVTLLFSYIFIIVGIITNYFNSQDIFIAYIFETAIILAFIALKASISFWHQTTYALENNQLPIKISYLRLFLFNLFLLCAFAIFVFVFLTFQWKLVSFIYQMDFSVFDELMHLKSLILLLLGHHIFSFLFNFIRNKEYLSYFKEKNSLLIIKLAFNRIFVMQFMIFLFIPLIFIGFSSNFLLIPFIVIRYYYDLKAHRESHERSN